MCYAALQEHLNSLQLKVHLTSLQLQVHFTASQQFKCRFSPQKHIWPQFHYKKIPVWEKNLATIDSKSNKRILCPCQMIEIKVASNFNLQCLTWYDIRWTEDKIIVLRQSFEVKCDCLFWKSAFVILAFQQVPVDHCCWWSLEFMQLSSRPRKNRFY